MKGRKTRPTSWERQCLAFIRAGASRLAWSVVTGQRKPIPPRLVRKGWAKYTGRNVASAVPGIPPVRGLALTERGAAVLRSVEDA